MKHQDALDQLALETSRARRRLLLERALRAGLILAMALGAWALFALTGAHERLPLLAQSLSAIAALALLAWLAWRAWQGWRTPSEDEARARLAADARLDGGTFDMLRDQPSRYDPLSVALWRRARERALELAEHARAGPAQPRLDEIDRYKIRYALIAAFAAALIFAGPETPDRLARAFLPDPGPLLGDQPMAVEAWAAPAEYTHAAPVSLSDRLGETIATPPSVDVTVRLTGPVGAPLLLFQGQGGRRSARFVRAADGAWEAHLAIPGVGRLKIVRFHTRAAWRIAPARDTAPSAAFTAPIAALADERATIAWRASDDYGVRSLALRIIPVTPPPGLAHADPIDTELEAPAGDPRDGQAESEVDLAAHPYAGMNVEVRLVATDALGQEGVSEAMHFTLPEKVFLQPLARAAIEIRRHVLAERRLYREGAPAPRRTTPAGDLVLGNQRIELRDYEQRPALARAPEGIRHAARLVDALTMAPQDGYFRDLAVYLGLRLARSELAAARDIHETEVAAETLWQTALRAEYGGAADTRRALEEAQRQLADALAQGAPQERIRQLLDALRAAADRYMQSLVQEALRNGERSNTEDTGDRAEISGQDIEEMLRQVQRLSEQGRNAEAQALLQSLAAILENLNVELGEGEGAGESGEQEQRMQESMDELSEAMGEQRALNDETQQQQQQQDGQGGGGGEQQGGQGGAELADQQSQIRQGLAEAQRMANESGAAPSDDLNAAGEAMRQAERALRRGDLEGAEAAQTAALEGLREGAEALGAEMRARGREGQDSAGGGPVQRDPLGRPLPQGANGPPGDPNTRLPDGLGAGADPLNTREIYDEIRRRAEDPSRPEAEREYLRRLLDRFGDS
jgi:hypothetical protein